MYFDVSSHAENGVFIMTLSSVSRPAASLKNRSPGFFHTSAFFCHSRMWQNCASAITRVEYQFHAQAYTHAGGRAGGRAADDNSPADVDGA